jgi:hypothetical protein
MVVVAREAEPLSSFQLSKSSSTLCMLLDAVPDGKYRIGDSREVTASREGVLKLPVQGNQALEVELVE